MTPERTEVERIRHTLETVIYNPPEWSGPPPWFKPNVLDALEALAVLERQLAEAKGTSEILSQHLAATAQKLDGVERQLAEKDEALRLIASDHPGFDTGWQQAWQSAGAIAREALRAEPAKEEA